MIDLVDSLMEIMPPFTYVLRVEKVVTGSGTVTIRIRALEPGRYRFFDDFNPNAQGYLVVQ